MKRFTPAFSLLGMTLLLAATAVGAQTMDQSTHVQGFSDVPGGAWYEADVRLFLDRGYLDPAQGQFRPGDIALRSEVVKLLIEPNGGVQEPISTTPSFDDVKPGNWYYGYFEEAGKRKWVRGDLTCLERLRPCNARPLSAINRAEAATLIARVFALTRTRTAPVFQDNTNIQTWYFRYIQIAADHCILRGDEGTGRVRPESAVNRAEIVAMIARALENLSYDANTGTCARQEDPSAGIEGVTQKDDHTLQVRFNVDLMAEDEGAVPEEEIAHYTLTGSGNLTITAQKRIDARTVELTVKNALAKGQTFTLNVRNLLTSAGKTFSDGETFTTQTGIQTQAGTLTIAYVSVPDKSRVGSGTLLGRFLLTGTGENISLTSLKLRQTGTASGVILTNLRLRGSGAVFVTTAATASGSTYFLTFSPVHLLRAGQSVTLDLVGDLRKGSGSGGTLRFEATSASDITATGTNSTRAPTVTIKSVPGPTGVRLENP